MGHKKRGNVWLAVAGLIVKDQKWLVVKKRYGGLKGKWSLPAGFVEPGETFDQAAIREVHEETGIECKIKGLTGIRTGVLQNEISDNLLIFSMEMIGGTLSVQKEELYEAAFLTKGELLKDENTSLLVRFFLEQEDHYELREFNDINPGDHFGYTSYKIFV